MFVQPQSAPITRSTSEVSLHPTMRRRSMIQTPGVATRPSPSPTTGKTTRASARHSHPPTPNMSRQPSTHFEEPDDHFSLPLLSVSNGIHSEASRTPTPKDTDYSITGAFKYGTLRIINGSPVLAPNPGMDPGEAEHTEIASKNNNHSVVEDHRETGATCGGLGLDYFAQSDGLVSDPTGGSKCALEADGKNLLPSQSIISPERGFASQDISELLPNLESIQQRPVSPLMTQSRQAAVDDNLFEDDMVVSVPEVLDIRIDVNARSYPLQSTDATEVLEGGRNLDNGLVSKSKSSSSQSHSSLAKADSGYSSNISVRSLRHSKNLANSEEGTGISSNDSNQGQRSGQRIVKQRPRSQVPDSAPAWENPMLGTQQGDHAPNLPPKDDFVVRKIRSSFPAVDNVRPASSTTGTMRRQSVHHQPAAIDTSQIPERQEFNGPKSAPLSPMSSASDGTSSSLTIGSNVQRPGRLQRLLSLKNSPFSKQAYTVHVTHSVDNRTPPIPKEAEAQLRERTGLNPVITKRLALNSQMSKETLKTILSVGSLEHANDDHLPHTTTIINKKNNETKAVEFGDAREKLVKSTFSSMQSNLKTAAASMMPSRKHIARKPMAAREPQEAVSKDVGKDESMLPMEPDLTSYLAVNRTLGNNAYDSGARALSPPTNPHRTMSMVTGHDHYSHSRTYSLSSADAPARTSSFPNTRPESLVSHEHATSPQISMATRTDFRTPPPRSPMSPQGPAVLPKKSHEKASRPMSHSAALAAGHRLGQHRVHGGGRPHQVASASTSQVHTSWLPPSRHNAVGSQTPVLAHSRHSSISSVRSDFMRDLKGSQDSGQHTSAWPLKHPSSLERVGSNQFGSHELHTAPHYDTPPGHRDGSSLGGRPMSVDQYSLGAPPSASRDQHRRNLSFDSKPVHTYVGGKQPPYRVLHSYNSPAYRNAPIWG